MLDVKIHTFLTLCQVMNYRKTAEVCNMTQPAVTQHIHGLESLYGVKLFRYNGRVLTKTPECLRLEQHAQAVVYNETAFQQGLIPNQKRRLAIGATKTIGEYVLDDLLLYLLDDTSLELEIIVENTHVLLQMLNNLELDFVMLEGHFDKTHYGYRHMRQEELVGICAVDHPFANRTITMGELFSQHLFLREAGSGTRSVFETHLLQHNLTLQHFPSKTVLSSFKLIEHVVALGRGISFVYQTIAIKNDDLATFRLEQGNISHEFNYVFLKDGAIRNFIDTLPL
ncbi:MAG: LysR family transcriptional regulator [Eubacteriales bacterium]